MNLRTLWQPARRATVIGIVCCAALLTAFAGLSYTAVLGKSPTYDEPLHAVAGYVHRTMGDFRINPEDPALFGYWGSLCQSGKSLKIVTDYKSWDKMIDDFSTNQWYFVWATLFKTPGNDGDAFIQRSRFMFVLVGIALGGLIALWSWRLAGAWAAVAATALFALDPNFLGHSALVKNDVMLSLMFAGLSYALWRFGTRGTWLSLAGIALTTAAAVNTKFSGVLCGPLILGALLIRALLRDDWVVLGRLLVKRWQRLLVAPAVCTLVGVVSYAGIWACYDFRFAPTHDPNALLNSPYIVQLSRINRVKASFEGQPVSNEEFAKRFEKENAGALAGWIGWAIEKRLLPQAWLHGFLYTYATTTVRSCYLLGKIRITGWWYYFPLAMLFKTPTATLAAIPLVGAGLIVVGYVGRAITRQTASNSASQIPAWRWLGTITVWPIICIALPAAIYGGSAMSTNLNLGLRHILPVYPFLFIALGVGLARLIRASVPAGATLAGLLLLGLAAESLSARPDYLAFFNTPCGGSRGGIALLGDSNLDWGQDLKTLAAWRAEHTDRPLYLAYFGVADPSCYVKDAINVPVGLGGWPFDPQPGMPNGSCYFAISVTNLQGIYLNGSEAQKVFDEFRHHEPLAILGGSIYVYAFPLTESSRL